MLALLSFTAHAVEPDRALLHIVTSPAGAAITLDGTLVGISPRTESLPPGVHTVTAELSGAVTTHTFSLAKGDERKLTLSLIPPKTPRPAPVAGLVTFGGGGLALGLGLLLRLPAHEAAAAMQRLYDRGGGWDDPARKLETSGLAAQTWSWFFTGAGVAVMAAGLLVTGLQLFGPHTDLPVLVLFPTAHGAALSFGARW